MEVQCFGLGTSLEQKTNTIDPIAAPFKMVELWKLSFTASGGSFFFFKPGDHAIASLLWKTAVRNNVRVFADIKKSL